MSEEQGYMKNVEFLDEFDDVFKEDDIEPYDSHVNQMPVHPYARGIIYNPNNNNSNGNDNNNNMAEVNF